MYGTHSCPFCVRADQFLQRKGVSGVHKLWIDENPQARVEMHARTGRRSVPQIFIGEHHVGGFDDLVVLDRSGKLDQLLAE
jgi:glutaredoxin 3